LSNILLGKAHKPLESMTFMMNVSVFGLLQRVGAMLAVLFLIGSLSACGSNLPVQTCTTGSLSRLYLGQDTPAGEVTELQWQRFVEDVVTPSFPVGFTVFDAKGQWRANDGTTQKENTRVLEIVHDNSPLVEARVRALAHAYKRIFAQQSVLVSQSRTYQCS
jgi:hypothetical protein